MSKIMKTVSQFLSKILGVTQSQDKPAEKALIATPASSNDELFDYVKRKMTAMENEALQNRMKSLETVVKHLVFEVRKGNMENQLLREMVVGMSTNIEELLNISSNTVSLPLETAEEAKQAEEEEESYDEPHSDRPVSTMDYEDKELQATWDLHGRKAAKKLRIN